MLGTMFRLRQQAARKGCGIFRVVENLVVLTNDVTDVYSLMSWTTKERHGLGTPEAFKEDFISPIQARTRLGASPQEREDAMQCLDTLQDARHGSRLRSNSG